MKHSNIIPRGHRAVTAPALVFLAFAACSDATRPNDNPSLVDVEFCTAVVPDWVAFQDGDGAWTRALPTNVGSRVTFHHEFVADRGAIAVGRTFGPSDNVLAVQYGTPEELSAVGDTRPQSCVESPVKTLSGTVGGLESDERAVVSAGLSSHESATPSSAFGFTLHGVAAGPQEVIAVRLKSVNSTTTPIGIIARRSVDVADGGAIPTLDFRAAGVLLPTAHTITLGNFDSDGMASLTGIQTADGNNVVTFIMPSITDVARTYYGFPGSGLADGDLQYLLANTSPTATSNVVRSAVMYFHDAADQTLTLGAQPTPPELTTVSTSPTLRLRARFADQTSYDRSAAISYDDEQAAIISVTMTAAYAARAGNAGNGFDLTMPDLTGVEGFDTRWALHPRPTIFWRSTRIGGTLGLGLNAIPHAGDLKLTGADAGFITP